MTTPAHAQAGVVGHTPGPLSIHRQEPPCTITGFYHVTASPDRPAIAYVCNREDAVLFAAAPDLLAACWAARAYVASHTHDSAGERLKQIESAIAKAEGRLSPISREGA